jgi:hypothetical protein
MKKRNLLVAGFGLAVCLCWALTSSIAEQPSKSGGLSKSGSSASVDESGSSGSTIAVLQPSGTKHVEPTDVRPLDAQGARDVSHLLQPILPARYSCRWAGFPTAG